MKARVFFFSFPLLTLVTYPPRLLVPKFFFLMQPQKATQLGIIFVSCQLGVWGISRRLGEESKIRGNPQCYDLSSVLISLVTRTINVETNREPILGGGFRRLWFSLNGFSKKKIDLSKAGAGRPAPSERAWLLALFLIKR